ncbi:MAG: excalibur calcium-binding domain-containing protein [Aphanocapsa sp. GSE-SYN-MK-11-07L]|nr:excalibur calcium-binding domain-containing protein [Aphanocapsa sp. GSE-SYN-MK-11-07L]
MLLSYRLLGIVHFFQPRSYPGDPFRLDRDNDGIACEFLK